MFQRIFSISSAILLVFSISIAGEMPYLISGFDDVLRQAENTGLLKAAVKLFESDRGFTGMPELYQAITHQESPPQFVLVSAISSWFDKRIDSFLFESGFPSNRRYLRNWLTEWSVGSFKIEKIKEILNEKPNRQFIVIFDNSDASIEVAKKIHHEFSKKILAVYLRQVQSKKLPSDAIGFYTAFDIAAHEYANGRLSSENVYKVGQTILNERKVNLIIPSYAICPLAHNACGSGSSDISEMCLKIDQHIRSLCETKTEK